MVGGGIPAQIMLQLTFQLVLWGLVKEYASLTSSWLCNQINAKSLGDRESLNGIIAYTRTQKNRNMPFGVAGRHSNPIFVTKTRPRQLSWSVHRISIGHTQMDEEKKQSPIPPNPGLRPTILFK